MLGERNFKRLFKTLKVRLGASAKRIHRTTVYDDKGARQTSIFDKLGWECINK